MEIDEKRAYRSSLREEQAAETRRRVLEAAAECFTESGYQGTSLARIAQRAGVSVDTVQATGAKRDILLGAFERAFVGRETRAILDEDTAFSRLVAIPELGPLIQATCEFTVAATGRIRGLWWAFRGAAASDPGVQEILAGLLERRRADFRALAGLLRERGAPIVDEAAVAVEAELLLAPETYAHFVDDHGWPEERYLEWVVAGIGRVIGLPPRG